jgi:hypothetical protein
VERGGVCEVDWGIRGGGRVKGKEKQVESSIESRNRKSRMTRKLSI